MVTLYAQVANPGYITDALLVGTSLAILDVWHWRKWLHLWHFPANIKDLGALVYIHTTASKNMNLNVHIDPIIVHMLVQNALLWVIYPSWWRI